MRFWVTKMAHLSELLGITSEIKIIDFLMDNVCFNYTISELKNYTGLSRPTLLRAIRKLLNNGIVIKTDTNGSRIFYSISVNDITRALGMVSLAQICRKEAHTHLWVGGIATFKYGFLSIYSFPIEKFI